MSYAHLTSKDRVELAVLLRAGHMQNRIAKLLSKDPSTISRELKRNRSAHKTGCYSARVAKQKTRARRIKANQRFRKIENNAFLRRYIIAKLQKYWSPEQIAGRLNHRKKKTIICHETIYKYIYQECPEFKRYLRCQKGKYRRKPGTRKREKQREEAKKQRIDLRPKIVEQRKRLGDWEGDIFFGRERKIGIMTTVERRSGFLCADKMESLLASEVCKKATQRLKSIPKGKRHTLTYDNDTRFADYELIARNAQIDIYFAYPYHAWERGTNENTNGLLRQFFPKKTSFSQ